MIHYSYDRTAANKIKDTFDAELTILRVKQTNRKGNTTEFEVSGGFDLTSHRHGRSGILTLVFNADVVLERIATSRGGYYEKPTHISVTNKTQLGNFAEYIESVLVSSPILIDNLPTPK